MLQHLPLNSSRAASQAVSRSAAPISDPLQRGPARSWPTAASAATRCHQVPSQAAARRPFSVPVSPVRPSRHLVQATSSPPRPLDPALEHRPGPLLGQAKGPARIAIGRSFDPFLLALDAPWPRLGFAVASSVYLYLYWPAPATRSNSRVPFPLTASRKRHAPALFLLPSHSFVLPQKPRVAVASFRPACLLAVTHSLLALLAIHSFETASYKTVCESSSTLRNT